MTIGYRLPVSKDVNLTFNAGGYFALGLSGKSTLSKSSYSFQFGQEGNLDNISSDYSVSEYKQNGDTDFGLLGGIGVEYKRFSLNANYEFGLRTLHTATSSDGLFSTWKNRNLTFSVGYRIK